MLEAFTFGRDRPRARFALERFMEIAGKERATGVCIDVGCGRGDHVELLKKNGPFREVHGLDVGERPRDKEDRYFSTPLESFDAPHPYDAIWCSHTLEHTRNPGLFLERMRSIAAPGAVICVTVPPLRHDITVGHVTLWNAGVLLLNLVKAGFDCSRARIRRSGYNVSVIIVNRPSGPGRDFGTDPATSLRPYLPDGLRWYKRDGVWYFDGDIRSLNWR